MQVTSTMNSKEQDTNYTYAICTAVSVARSSSVKNKTKQNKTCSFSSDRFSSEIPESLLDILLYLWPARISHISCPTLSLPVPGSRFNSNQEMTEQRSRYVNVVLVVAGKENEMECNEAKVASCSAWSVSHNEI